MSDSDERQELRDAVRELRAEVPVRREWRSRVLDAVAAEPSPSSKGLDVARGVEDGRMAPGRGWVGWTSAALAASLLLATGVVIGRRSVTQPVDTVFIASPAGASVTPVANASVHAIRFVLTTPGSSVSLVGDFNGWDPTTSPLKADPDGRWSTTIMLPAGRHVYAFVVDGRVVADPTALRSAEDDYGIPNSVVLVGGGGGIGP